MEGETLPVEPRCHDGKEYRRRPDKRYDFVPFPLRDGDDICPRIGHRRATGFRDNADGFAPFQRSEVSRHDFGCRVFVELREGLRVDVDARFYLLQEAAGRADVLYDEMSDG